MVAQKLHVHLRKMLSGDSKYQIKPSWRNLNSLACSLPNATKDVLATETDLRTADCKNRYSQLRGGSRKKGCPKLKHKDIFKRDQGFMNIPLDNWQYLSKNRKTEGKKIS